MICNESSVAHKIADFNTFTLLIPRSFIIAARFLSFRLYISIRERLLKAG